MCPQLSTLHVTLSRTWKWTDHLVPNTTSAMIRFIHVLSPQLVRLALWGDHKSAMPKILEGVQHARFSRPRVLHIDWIQYVSSQGNIDTSGSCANILVHCNSQLWSLSIRHDTYSGDPRLLVAYLNHNCGVLKDLRRLDLDLGEIEGDQCCVGPSFRVDTQKRTLDSVHQLRGLRHLILRQSIMWSADPDGSTGVVSGFSPRSTFRAEPRTFRSLITLSFSLQYLRAQIFEDLAEAAPCLEEVDLEFAEFWLPVTVTGGSASMETEIRCASRVSPSSLKLLLAV
jgi:hypothetical protein